MPKSFTLRWTKFSRLTEARIAFRKTACIYLQTDSADNIIRIGKAAKGLEARYRGGTGYAIDAAMHGSGNSVFVAAVPEILCSAIEDELIWMLRNHCEYNNQGKRREPKTHIRLKHIGEVPSIQE